MDKITGILPLSAMPLLDLQSHFQDMKSRDEMTRYVTVKKAAELTGYTEAAIRDKIRDGVWLMQRVWLKAPDGRVLINMEGYERWVESQSTTVFGPVSSPEPLKPLSKNAKGISKCKLQPLT